jgi:hypothetical protein
VSLHHIHLVCLLFLIFCFCKSIKSHHLPNKRNETLPHETKQLTAFFERLGYVCPPRFNPADFALELASTKVIQGHPNLDGAPETEVIEQHGDVALLVRSNSSPKLVESCAAHIVQQNFDPDLLTPDNKHKGVVGVKGANAPFMVQFRTNLRRAWMEESRERVGIAVRVIMNVLLGLVFGLLYFRQIPVRVCL